MREEKRIALLQEVARVAPDCMGAQYRSATPSSTGEGEAECAAVIFGSRSTFSLLMGDRFDAAAIIEMLDAMQQARAEWMLRTVANSRGITRYQVVIQNLSAQLSRSVSGQTRAEAVARAFLAVFSEQKTGLGCCPK